MRLRVKAHSTAFGIETVAEGTGATAWGRKAKATGDYSTAWGFNTEAINDKSTAFGDNTIAGGKIATAWGYKTAAGGRTSTAFGSETVALTEGATAWGNNTKAGKWTYAGHDVFIKKEGDGLYHIIDEYGNSGSNGLPGQTFVSYDEAYKELSTNGTVQGVYATAWGKDTKAEGDYSTAFGVGTVASGSGATAWGNGAQATGDYSTAIGAVGVNSSSGADSAVNTNTEAQADYSVAVLGGITRKQDDINAINSVALGGAYDASRPGSDYFKPSLTNAPYSIALLGGETASTATNSLAIGNRSRRQR